MKKVLLIAVCLILMCTTAFASAQGEPIEIADVMHVQQTGRKTIGEYYEALKPSELNWFYEGDETGYTCFMFTIGSDSVTLRVAGATDYQNDEEGMDGDTSLTGDVLNLPATVVEAVWTGNGLEKVVMLPRGIKLGDTRDSLEQTISELEFFSIDPEETDEGVTEGASCSLDEPEQGEVTNDYYGFDFFLKDGALLQAQMWYASE